MLNVTELKKSFGTTLLFSNISFSLEKGKKVALVGSNGSGLEEYEQGDISITQNAAIGFLPQDTSQIEEMTIREYIRNTAQVDVILDRMRELEHKLDSSEYHDLEEKLLRLDGYSFDHKMEEMLDGFGLVDIPLNRMTTELSSGQKTKVELIGILLKGVDLLLLDEPTNNLDLPSLLWLENYLIESSVTVIVVSHDRRFLDRTIRKVFEIDNQSLLVSHGSYSDYIHTKSVLLSRQKEQYKMQQEELQRLSARALRLREKSRKGSQWEGKDHDLTLRDHKRERAGRSGKAAKVVERRIERIELQEEPVERVPLCLEFEPDSCPDRCRIEVNELIIGYPNKFQAGPISFDVPYGVRIAIMGVNGSGKSTLLKTVNGDLPPLSGSVNMGLGLSVGNMMQEHELLSREETVLQCVLDRTDLSSDEALVFLEQFNLSASNQKIAILSPGERARLLLAIFSAQSVNALFLDEPTNHLDLEALEALEEVLETFEGTVFVVTHDRCFLESSNLNYVYTLTDEGFNGPFDAVEYIAEHFMSSLEYRL